MSDIVEGFKHHYSKYYFREKKVCGSGDFVLLAEIFLGASL